jgi:hypothetical protein
VAFEIRGAFWVKRKGMTRERSCMTHWRIQPRRSDDLLRSRGYWLCKNLEFSLYAPCSLLRLLLISLFDWFG